MSTEVPDSPLFWVGHESSHCDLFPDADHLLRVEMSYVINRSFHLGGEISTARKYSMGITWYRAETVQMSYLKPHSSNFSRITCDLGEERTLSMRRG